jgi:hypothetical protein
MKFASIFSSVIASVYLVACGGGGSNTAATTNTAATAISGDVVDKYIGTWTTCTSFPGAGFEASQKLKFVFTKKTATTLSYILTSDTYVGAGCTSRPDAGGGYQEIGEFAFVGTKIIEADKTVDKLNITAVTPVASNHKDIGAVNGTLLYLGDIGPVDSSGYPTALDTVDVLIKQ